MVVDLFMLYNGCAAGALSRPGWRRPRVSPDRIDGSWSRCPRRSTRWRGARAAWDGPGRDRAVTEIGERDRRFDDKRSARCSPKCGNVGGTLAESTEIASVLWQNQPVQGDPNNANRAVVELFYRVEEVKLSGDKWISKVKGKVSAEDIVDEATFGPDFGPDWDGSPLADLVSSQTEKRFAYTWRNDFGSYAPGRLDFFIYSDSVITTGNHFLLYTPEMSAGELATYGLQAGDVTTVSDHLPLADVEVARPVEPRVGLDGEPRQRALGARRQLGDLAIRPVALAVIPRDIGGGMHLIDQAVEVRDLAGFDGHPVDQLEGVL